MKTGIMIFLMTALLTANNAFASSYVPAEHVPAGVQTVSIQQSGGPQVSYMEAQVVADVNAQRARYGLQALRIDPQLTAAARVRAKEIAQKFSHTRPDGTKWNTVSSAALGENIARGHNSAYRVMAAWMSSPGHRENILRERFGSIGVCAVQVNGVMHWVQLFGR